jgi:septum formation protein
LLKQLGLKFSLRPSTVEEVIDPRRSPAANARLLALAKARDVSNRVRLGIVIGADTIVALGNTMLGKPKDRRDARRMLKLLSGKEHIVYTGFALVDAESGRYVAKVEKTRVRFRQLSDAEIRRYVASGAPMDKAGAYGIQDDHGAIFVDKVNGCFYNVVGFPLTRFYLTLQEFLRQRR